MMLLGVDGVFVGSGIFKSDNPSMMAKAIVEATTHFNDPKLVAKVSKGIGDPMRGIEISQIDEKDLLQTRGW
jgi:pyridoxal 5'-phosphate synthase pdxS subunit